MGLPTRSFPDCAFQDLVVTPSRRSSCTNRVVDPARGYSMNMRPTMAASASLMISLRSTTSYPRGGTPPIQIPLRLLAAHPGQGGLHLAALVRRDFDVETDGGLPRRAQPSPAQSHLFHAQH